MTENFIFRPSGAIVAGACVTCAAMAHSSAGSGVVAACKKMHGQDGVSGQEAMRLP